MFTFKLIKVLATILVAPLLAFLFFNIVPTETVTDAQTEDAATYYKAKCVVCHGAKADKKFDSSLSEEHLVDAVLKGKKAAKPPHMPEYESKGVTPEQAKELVIYMKQLKTAGE